MQSANLRSCQKLTSSTQKLTAATQTHHLMQSANLRRVCGVLGGAGCSQLLQHANTCMKSADCLQDCSRQPSNMLTPCNCWHAAILSSLSTNMPGCQLTCQPVNMPGLSNNMPGWRRQSSKLHSVFAGCLACFAAGCSAYQQHSNSHK